MRSFYKKRNILLVLGLLGASAVHAENIHSIVLVHGAFADGTSWEQVLPPLLSRNYEVIAVQEPLTSLEDDVAATKRAIARAKGDVILVGHSWGGTVITQAGNDPKVKGLVYINAFAPSVGQSTADLIKSAAPAQVGSKIAQDHAGYLYLPPEVIANDFAQDAASDEIKKIVSIVQGPIKASSFDQKVSYAAWQHKPSWYLVGTEDHMINVDLERAMAKKINARTTELPVGHVPMLSDPLNVARMIFKAVNITSGY